MKISEWRRAMTKIHFRKEHWIGPIATAVLSAILLISGAQQLQAQNGSITVPDNKIPDLKGIWEINMSNLCGYVNILDETVPPAPYCGVPPDTSTTIQITDQSGRVFAGSHLGSSDKFTGIVEYDGTISIQYWSTDPQEWEHIFLKAKLYRENKDYVMRGYFHGKSELPMPEDQGGVPYMQTTEVYVVRIGPLPEP
jgi:hypothetical protein